jgi:hypothetical protein
MVVPHTTLPNTKDNTQPIIIILDGSNYQAWSQNMSRWLKGHCLWEYVFGKEPKPIARKEEPANAFSTYLCIWKSIHYRIIFWFSNTYVVSISITFGNLDNAKDVWDMLAQHYNTTDLAQRFQIVTKLHRMRQEPGQSIIGFYSQMTHLWNQLAYVSQNGGIRMMPLITLPFMIACTWPSFLRQFRMSLRILGLLFFTSHSCHPWKVLLVNSF